jgi:hypothetical protein
MPRDDATPLEQLTEYEALAEKGYDDMYDSRSPAACYSDLKDHFASAIDAANRAGLPVGVERLTKRLDHCRQVYRKQFSAF